MGMPKEIRLSQRAARVASQFAWTVLPNTRDVLPGSGLSKDQIKRGLSELKEKDFVVVDELGCFLPAAPVLRFTEQALDYSNLSEEEKRWLGPHGVGRLLLHDFAKVEAAQSVAPLYATGGWELSRIYFFERQEMIAAAEYYHPAREVPAYLVFCWASLMDTQRVICERLERLQEDLQVHSENQTRAFSPAGIALLAASEWAVARALCMARATLSEWVSPEYITGWYYGSKGRDYDSGGWYVSGAASALTGKKLTALPSLGEPTDWLRPPASTRELGNDTVENILARSLWVGRRGQKLVQLLTLAAIHPCGSTAHYRGLIGEEAGGKETGRRLKVLQELGMIEVVTKYGRAKRRRRWPEDVPVTLSEHGQGAQRYAATLSGRVQFCNIHGGSPEDLFRRTRVGSLKTVVRLRVFLHLLRLSWMVHLCYAPWVRPVDLPYLDELERNWKELREEALVYLLTLACMVHHMYRPKGRPVRRFILADIARIWTQLQEVITEDRWLYQHEDIVLEIFAQCRKARCAFAPGWQGNTNLAGSNHSINPDGMILVTTPWGRIWCYLEVELSRRTCRAIKPRYDKYWSKGRQDDLPVLIVCRDEDAEENFRLAAAESDSPPRLLTTTLTRLKKGGMFGPGVWFGNGQQVTLAP